MKEVIYMKEILQEETVKELTLVLMYLTRFTERNRFGILENNAWKGYSFDILDELEEEGYIDQGRYYSKSVQISKEGLEKIKILLEKYGIKE